MTAREDKERSGRETSPGRLPDTTPEVFPGKNYDFTLQAVFEMQKTMGQLTQAIQTLTEESKESKKTLNRISHIIYGTTAVLLVLGTIAGWVLGKAWELLVPYLHVPKP